MFARELNTPEPILREMYWYDIILMLNEYNDMVEENENNNQYKDSFEQYQSDITSKLPNINSSNIKMPNISNMNSITSGFKFPSL